MDGRTINDNWGALAFRGILTILFGIAAVFWPGITLVTFVYLFGAFILISGLSSMIMGLTNIHNDGGSGMTRLLLILVGIIEIGAGVYLLRHPAVSFTTLILIVGFTLIFKGVIDIFSGLFEREGAMYKTVFVIGGVLTALAGIVLLFQPAASGAAFVWILGLYALITGPLLIALALEVKHTGLNEINRRLK